MADSNENNTNSPSENDSDKLDDMLNEAELSMDDSQEDELIDRLLIDDEKLEDSDEVLKNEVDEVDEFSEKNTIDIVVNEIVAKEGDEAAEDELLETEIESTKLEKNVPDDIEQQMDEIDVEGEKESKNTVDDFLMDDFDISADDDFADSEEDKGLDAQNEEVKDNAEAAQGQVNPSESNSSQNEGAIENTVVEIDNLKLQINKLWAENNAQKEQITALTDAVDSEEQYESIVEEIGRIQTVQHKFKKSLKEGGSKVPVVSYIAIGIAVLALLIGGGLGVINSGGESELTELSELMLILEEEVELLAAKDSSAEIKKIRNTVTALEAQEGKLQKQLLKVVQILKLKLSQSDIEGLIAENKQSKQVIEQLLKKVAALEKRKFVSATKPRVVVKKKVKKPIVKVSWVVNLVSFKQEWFANRKASEFDGKGISTEVMPVNIKGENWYRSRVVGFKTKYEAATYAVKAKKTLNLSSVWVAKDQ